MPDKLPSPRDEVVRLEGERFLISTSWYRYFLTNDLPTLSTTQTTQAATIATQAAQILVLQQAISTIRDVAILNTLTSGSEIPDLGRR